MGGLSETAYVWIRSGGGDTGGHPCWIGGALLCQQVRFLLWRLGGSYWKVVQSRGGD